MDKIFTKNTYKMATKEGSESEEDERKKAEKVEKLGMQLTLMIKTAQMVAEIDAGEVSQKEVVKALLGALIEEKKSTKDMQLENKELVKNVLKKVKETVDEKAGMSNPSNNDSKINTSFIDKYIIKLIMFITKGPTDTSQSYEFTDWEKVDVFARELWLNP